MKRKQFHEFDISMLTLGTAQFGLPYGIANVKGQPQYDEVVRILEAAIEGGVNCFDTAAAYGSSEEVLARALTELGVLDKVTVVTKVMPLTEEELADPALGEAAVRESIETSRRRLGLDCLPLVLFHRETDAAKYLHTLCKLRDRGWIRHVGISCGNAPEGARELSADEQVEALQIPANILDQRHSRAGNIKQAARHGKVVFVRSVYLQGLIVMPEEDIPEHLREIVPVRRAMAEISRRYDIELPELAMRYILSVPGVASIVSGVDSVEQLNENIRLIERGPLAASVVAEIDRAVPELDEYLITPSQW